MKRVGALSLRSLLFPLFFLFLCSCWIPENFVARVDVHRDGGYSFVYDGTLAFAPVLAAVSQGALSEEDKEELKEMALELKDENGYQEFRYVGRGRFDVLAEKKGASGETYYFMSESTKIFAIEYPDDGTLKISALRPAGDVVRQLSSIGVTMSGKLNVTVPWGTKVIRHNADREPFFFGLFGAYSWDIEEPDADPFMLLEL